MTDDKRWEARAMVLAGHLAGLHEDYAEELESDEPQTYIQYWINFADWKIDEIRRRK
jgi:hypothetical protein